MSVLATGRHGRASKNETGRPDRYTGLKELGAVRPPVTNQQPLATCQQKIVSPVNGDGFHRPHLQPDFAASYKFFKIPNYHIAIATR
jgi:hypothetical protein